jgi:hypothetical protein
VLASTVIPQIQNVTNTSTTTNNVKEELTVQSRGSCCLKLQSDMGPQETLSSTVGQKRARAQPRRFEKSFIYKSGQRLFKFCHNEISNRP